MPMAKPGTGKSPQENIDARIKEYPDWRGQMLSQLREVILRADSNITEEWKWNVPVWNRDGIICTGEVYKATVKLTFAKGASLEDPVALFNSSLEGNVRRAIDFHEGDKVKVTALKALVKAAARHNTASKKK